LYYAITTHLKLPEAVFWSATHRKILALLDIDKEVNTIPSKKSKAPQKPQTEKKKITLEEAMKIL